MLLFFTPLKKTERRAWLNSWESSLIGEEIKNRNKRIRETASRTKLRAIEAWRGILSAAYPEGKNRKWQKGVNLAEFWIEASYRIMGRKTKNRKIANL